MRYREGGAPLPMIATRCSATIRTIGSIRAEARKTSARLAYNFDRLAFDEKRAVAA